MLAKSRKTKKLNVLVLCPPGAWQRILQMSIESYSFVKVVNVATGSLSASQLVNEHYPDLIVIDSSVPFDDLLVLIRKVQDENHGTKSLIITDTTQQKRKAIQAGADFTISAYDIESHIGELLDQIRITFPPEKENTDTSVQTDPVSGKS
jgi:DNA-binding NarL/FixJ family response regulator